MPRSSAAPTTPLASAAVGATPKVALPRQIFETRMPVGPRIEYFIYQFPLSGGDSPNSNRSVILEQASWNYGGHVGEHEDQDEGSVQDGGSSARAARRGRRRGFRPTRLRR